MMKKHAAVLIFAFIMNMPQIVFAETLQEIFARYKTSIILEVKVIFSSPMYQNFTLPDSLQCIEIDENTQCIDLSPYLYAFKNHSKTMLEESLVFYSNEEPLFKYEINGDLKFNGKDKRAPQVCLDLQDETIVNALLLGKNVLVYSKQTDTDVDSFDSGEIILNFQMEHTE